MLELFSTNLRFSRHRGRDRQPITVDLTNIDLHTLQFVVDWYDRNWTINEIRTRSATIYDGPVFYEDFHNMALAFEVALASRNQQLPEPLGHAIPCVNLSQDDIFIAKTNDGFRVFAGSAAG